MLKYKSIWNAVRSLRGKKDKLSGSSQDADLLSDGKGEALELEESDLEKRVKLWLSESSPPPCTRSTALTAGANTTRQNQEYRFEAHQKMYGMNAKKSSNVVLYHPDFADWKSIHLTYGTPSPENVRPDDIFQFLDDATTSLSKLLVAPFGRE
jgi:hypothetical protein